LIHSGKQCHPLQQQQQQRQLDQIRRGSCSKTMTLMTMTRRHLMTMMTMGKPLAGGWQQEIGKTLSREQVPPQQQQLAVAAAVQVLHLSC
jgi:hypothetical protein